MGKQSGGDMKSTALRVVFIAAGLSLAACGQQQSGEQAASAPAATATSVFDIMNASIIPQSNQIWELAGDLYDDDGNIDGARLSDEKWQTILDAAIAMGAGAKTMAEATGLKAAPAGVKIQSEGTEGAAGAADVQAAMDADPKAFSEDAAQLVAIADEIVAAARAHDGMKTDDASARLTDVCGACHAKFWYPKQAAQ
jgi:cytochrome c556